MPMQPEVGASGPLAREFADYLRSVDGLAELTVDAYAAEARRYLDYLAECPASATAEPAAADGANGVISYLMARQGQGAGRFRDGAGILKYVLDCRADLIDADRQDLVNKFPANPECFFPGLAHRGAIGKNIDVVQRHPFPACQRLVHAGGPVMLYAYDLYPGVACFHVQGDTGD